MREISEIEIKFMTKEQNYMRGYKDGKLDVLDSLCADIEKECVTCEYEDDFVYNSGLFRVIEIIDKYRKAAEEVCDRVGPGEFENYEA